MVINTEKRKEDVKIAVARHRKRKKLSELGTAEDFDIKVQLNGDQREIYLALMAIITNKNPSVKALEIAFKMLGLLTDKREETVKIEYGANAIGRDAEGIIAYLKDRLGEAPGICPVCLRPNTLLTEICDNQEH